MSRRNYCRKATEAIRKGCRAIAGKLSTSAQTAKKAAVIVRNQLLLGVQCATKWFLDKIGILKRRSCQPEQECAQTPTPPTPEETFHKAWEDILANNAQVFNGLYGGLRRICRGTAKKPEKILREWAQRTHYQWENQQVDLLCQQLLLPPIQAADRSALESWATLLLEAAERAGICAEQHSELVLDAQTVKAYTEWNGAQLCEEDPVEILEPAWYQNGKLLEQGLCRHKVQPAKKKRKF